MITIRREQLDALAAPLAVQFVDEAVAHVAKLFPEQYAELGKEATREAVVHAIDRAEHHGLSSDGEVLTYVTLTFIFGRDFDSELSWAEAALRRRGSTVERLAHLQTEALMHESEGTGYASKLGGGADNG